MVKYYGVMSAMAVVLLLTGCQGVDQSLASINDDLSHLTGVPTHHYHTSTPAASTSLPQKHPKKTVAAKALVSDADAMRWLAHDHTYWDDNGRLKGINWMIFWEQQVKQHTALVDRANAYCKPLSASHVGQNCEFFFDASTAVSSQSMFSQQAQANDVRD